MRKKEEVVGNRYGSLVVIGDLPPRGKNRMVNCMCDCGKLHPAYLTLLKSGKTHSCGCRYKNRTRSPISYFANIEGMRFGNLVALEKLVESGRYPKWLFKCDCGNTKPISVNHVIKGTTKSCGCLHKKSLVKSRSALEKSRVDGVIPSSLTRKIGRHNNSGVKGVSIRQYKGKTYYIARIGFQKKTIHLGMFLTIEKAIKARKDGEEKYFTPFLEQK